MTKLYSKSTRGFYDTKINDKIPSDAVTISQDYYLKLLKGQGQLQEIVQDSNGFPVLNPIISKDEEYMTNREKNYPSIKDQLDMLYWDSVNKTDTWKKTIEFIKMKYPKPSEKT